MLLVVIKVGDLITKKETLIDELFQLISGELEVGIRKAYRNLNSIILLTMLGN